MADEDEQRAEKKKQKKAKREEKKEKEDEKEKEENVEEKKEKSKRTKKRKKPEDLDDADLNSQKVSFPERPSSETTTYISEFDNVPENTGEEYFEKSESDEQIVPPKSGTELIPGQVYKEEGRLEWDNNMDFLLSLIGFAVDVANIWGFPYFCLVHGGASFLIPYTIILVLCVIPVLYMELIMGQFVQQGSISVWKLCPFFKGIGWCMVLVSYFVSFYYNVVLAWALIYIYESLGFANIRWMSCDETWNTPHCISAITEAELDVGEKKNSSAVKGHQDSSKEFFKRHVLKLEIEGDPEYDLGNIGRPDTALSIALLLVYVILFIFLLVGIRVSGKLVWVTATVPYIILGLLLFRGLTLPGSSSGLYELIAPKFGALITREIWIDATIQVFFSAGAGFGVHLTYASFNNFQHNLLRDCILTMVVNTGTSILSGMVLFSYLGNLAYSTRRDVASVVKLGPEAVFESFPTAIGRLPGPNFFSFIFFLMLFLIGIDSSLGALSSITTAVIDEYKNWFSFHPRLRPTFIFACVSISYLTSLSCVTQGGIYLYTILNDTAASVSLMVAVFLQIMAIAYVFGLKELCDAAEAMTGRRPGFYFNVCWKFITPGILILIIIIGLVGLFSAVPAFEGKPVPTWGYIVGLIIAFVPILTVPIVALRSVFRIPKVSCSLKFKLAISPEHEYDAILLAGKTRRTTMKHLLWFECKCPKKQPGSGQGATEPNANVNAGRNSRRVAPEPSRHRQTQNVVAKTSSKSSKTVVSRNPASKNP